MSSYSGFREIRKRKAKKGSVIYAEIFDEEMGGPASDNETHMYNEPESNSVDSASTATITAEGTSLAHCDEKITAAKGTVSVPTEEGSVSKIDVRSQPRTVSWKAISLQEIESAVKRRCLSQLGSTSRGKRIDPWKEAFSYEDESGLTKVVLPLYHAAGKEGLVFRRATGQAVRWLDENGKRTRKAEKRAYTFASVDQHAQQISFEKGACSIAPVDRPSLFKINGVEIDLRTFEFTLTDQTSTNRPSSRDHPGFLGVGVSETDKALLSPASIVRWSMAEKKWSGSTERIAEPHVKAKKSEGKRRARRSKISKMQPDARWPISRSTRKDAAISSECDAQAVSEHGLRTSGDRWDHGDTNTVQDTPQSQSTAGFYDSTGQDVDNLLYARAAGDLDPTDPRVPEGLIDFDFPGEEGSSYGYDPAFAFYGPVEAIDGGYEGESLPASGYQNAAILNGFNDENNLSSIGLGETDEAVFDAAAYVSSQPQVSDIDTLITTYDAMFGTGSYAAAQTQDWNTSMVDAELMKTYDSMFGKGAYIFALSQMADSHFP